MNVKSELNYEELAERLKDLSMYFEFEYFSKKGFRMMLFGYDSDVVANSDEVLQVMEDIGLIRKHDNGVYSVNKQPY
jgi:hypothetical protein